MKKIQKLLSALDKDEFIEFYSTHTRKDTAIRYAITENDVKSYCHVIGFKKSRDLIGKQVSNFYNNNKLITVHIPGEKHYIKVSEANLQAYLDSGYILGYELSEDIKKQRIQKCKETKLQRYGDENYNNQEKNKQTKLERYGNENYNNFDKIKQTQLEKYGCLGFNIKEKYEATMLERYGVMHNWASKDPKLNGQATKYANAGSKENYYANIIKSGRQTRLELYGDQFYSNSEKAQKTMLEKYGVPYYTALKDCYGKSHTNEANEKRNKTMHENNSWSISKPEEDLYKLLVNKFNVENIIREYTDNRYCDLDTGYKFKCDFYIKPLDLFLELNYHPTHGLHPFDKNNENDIKLLEKLKENSTPWNNAVIDVWTIRDVKKLNTAIINNLNYKVLYPGEDYNDFIQRI